MKDAQQGNNLLVGVPAKVQSCWITRPATGNVDRTIIVRYEITLSIASPITCLLQFIYSRNSFAALQSPFYPGLSSIFDHDVIDLDDRIKWR